MIPFQRVQKPVEFHNKAEIPGNKWLARHPNALRPRDYWSPFRVELAQGFHDLCAYSAMYIPSGTVDHFVSFKENRSLAYDWSNYRYCAGWINASKRNEPSTNLLDPFEIGQGWFEIILPSLQLQVAPGAPNHIRCRAEYVMDRLHLRNDERVIRQRRSWLEQYECGELTLQGLKRRAPLIAAAVEKRDA